MKNTTLHLTLLAIFTASLAISIARAQAPAGTTFGSPSLGYLDGAYIDTPGGAGWAYDQYGTSAYTAYAGTDASAQLASYNGYTHVSWDNGHGGNGPSGNDMLTRFGHDGTYFWLYVEVPLDHKNMIWASDYDDRVDPSHASYDPVFASEFYLYQQGAELVHGPGTRKKLDYGAATGSEKFEFFDSSNNEYMSANFEKQLQDGTSTFKGMDDYSGPKALGHADSIDYLFATVNPDGSSKTALATEAESLNYSQAMSAEFVFKLTGTDAEKNAQIDNILGFLGGEVIVHLSPPKIPEPSSTVFLGLASVAALLRRKR